MKSYFKNLKYIHIWNVIKRKIDEKNIPYDDFAKALNCDRTNLYKIFRCKSIDVERLIVISQILHCNLLEEVYIEPHVVVNATRSIIASISLPDGGPYQIIIEKKKEV